MILKREDWHSRPGVILKKGPSTVVFEEHFSDEWYCRTFLDAVKLNDPERPAELHWKFRVRVGSGFAREMQEIISKVPGLTPAPLINKIKWCGVRWKGGVEETGPIKNIAQGKRLAGAALQQVERRPLRVPARRGEIGPHRKRQ